MANIYNYSKNAIPELKRSIKQEPAVACVVLMLLSIPLTYSANSISLGILALFTAMKYGVKSFRKDYSLLIPAGLYLLMALSLIWTIDRTMTINALSKELPLLIIPLCLMCLPIFTNMQRQLILKYYSYGMFAYCIFYLIKAVVRCAYSQDASVFFYHQQVTLDVNAVHVSLYMTIAFFWFLVKKEKSLLEKIAASVLFVMVFLLSSKNVTITFIFLLLVYYFFYAVTNAKTRFFQVSLLLVFLVALTFVGQIKERFRIEYDTVMNDGTVNENLSRGQDKVYNVSAEQAWSQEKFKANDFFPGTAYRIYKFRIFIEMLQEDNIFWHGYGLNASYSKIETKTIAHELYLGEAGKPGYQMSNFHNQYVQNFAELGIGGLLLLLAIVIINLKNGLRSKDFVHISFAVLMISLFLTESFLWRQRGVTYFTIMYCLFNAGIGWNASEKNKQQL